MTDELLAPLPDPTEETVLTYFHSRPAMVAPIKDCLRWWLRRPRPFAWWEARVPARTLDRLTLDGILDRVEGARYSFRNEQAALRALVRYDGELKRARQQVLTPSAPLPMPPGAPKDVFSEIIGYESVKRQILMALAAPEPIHCLLYGPPACLVADERVSLGNGAFAKIGDLGRSHLEPIRVSVQTGQGHGRAVAERFHIYRDQPIVEMLTESGKSIRGTPNQPVLAVQSGGRVGRGNLIRQWKRLDEIRPGDRVATVVRVRSSVRSPAPTGFVAAPGHRGPRFRGRLPTRVTDGLAALSGYMLGDGWVERSGYRSGLIVNSSEIDLLPQLTGFVRAEFGIEPATVEVPPEGRSHLVGNRVVTAREPVWRVAIRSRDVTSNLAFVGAKRAPRFILESTDRHVALFLRWLFEADGHARPRPPGKYGRRAGEVALTSIHIELLRDVQVLLLRFGIHSRVGGGPGHFRLTITRRDDILSFGMAIGFASAKKRARMDRVASSAMAVARSSRRHLTERVVSVRPAGTADVFDIEVPRGNRFVANGVVVHNTAKSIFLEGLSTLPGAVYRFADSVRRAGLRRYLIDEKPPILIIDELEKFGPEEDTALLEFMERQRISMMVTGQNRDEAVNIRVFSAANDIRRLRPELVSRFHRIELREYTIDEFRMVARQYLMKRGVKGDLAAMIADGVAERTRDIRDCRRIGSMSRTQTDAEFLLEQLGRESSVV